MIINFLPKKKVPPKILVCLCAYSEVKSEVARRLFQLQRCVDYPISISIRDGDALIERARSKVASDFLRSDYDILFFIDEDVVFEPIDVIKICKLMHENEDISICGAAYPKKGIPSHFAIKTLEENNKYPFGKDKGCVFEVGYLSTGFMGIKKKVFQELSQTLPLVHKNDLKYWTFFQPYNKEIEKDDWIELSEDWAFVERAKSIGFKIWCDSTTILKHIGRYEYSWADIFGQKKEEPKNMTLFEKGSAPIFEVV